MANVLERHFRIQCSKVIHWCFRSLTMSLFWNWQEPAQYPSFVFFSQDYFMINKVQNTVFKLQPSIHLYLHFDFVFVVWLKCNQWVATKVLCCSRGHPTWGEGLSKILPGILLLCTERKSLNNKSTINLGGVLNWHLFFLSTVWLLDMFKAISKLWKFWSEILDFG